MQKPSKHKKKNLDENNNETEKPKKPTARRHLLLIRHGQYNTDGDTDLERKLTALGMVCVLSLTLFSRVRLSLKLLPFFHSSFS